MPHTEIVGDMSLAMGTYQARENGQDKTKRRHRNIGVLMETTFEDGSRSMSVRLNAEVLTLEIQQLLRANKLLVAGDDSVICSVYRRDRKSKADTPAAVPPGTDQEYEPGPF